MKKLKKTIDAVQEADALLTRAAVPYRHTPPIEALAWASEIGDQPQMRLVCAGVIGAGLLTDRPRVTRAGVRMLLAHTLATWAKNRIKLRIDRTRPRSAGKAKNFHAQKIKPGRDTAKEETSFPSGHSAGAIAVARAWSREMPEYAGPAYVGAALIAVAQVPRCAHYPTDVGGGLLVGLAAEAVANAVWEAWAAE